jgi:parallel beta-helix repeat protein
MTGSSNGINFLSPGSSGPHDVTIIGAVAVGNTTSDLRIQGVDLVPEGATVTAGRNRIEGSTFVGTLLSIGIRIEEAPTNTITGNTIVGHSSGVAIDRSASNVVTGNQVIGGNTGASLSSAATNQLPSLNSLVGNRIVGVAARGVDLQDAVSNTLRNNAVIGAGSVGIRSISGGFLGGGQDNVLERNVITGGGGDGIALIGDDRNLQLIANVTNANDGVGIKVLSEAEGTILRGNRADENGADDPTADAGIFIDDPAGVEDPDVLTENSASRNGFLSEKTGDDVGLGIRFASDSDARRNVAKANDDPTQCDPDGFC